MLVYSGSCICASMCYEWCINLYMLHIILQEVIVSACVQWLLHMRINVL